MMLINHGSCPVKVALEGFIRPLFPFTDQKMIVEQIHQHTAVQAVVCGYAQAALPEMRVAAGKGVYPAMQCDPLADSWWKAVIKPAFDEVAHEISDQELIVKACPLMVTLPAPWEAPKP